MTAVPPDDGVAGAYTTRPATPSDVSAIATIYNQGITDRVATFETEPRSPDEIAAFPYSTRPCYAGVNEFSLYVAREDRRSGAGRAVLTALIETAAAHGPHKLTSRVVPENLASRGLLRGLGFDEIGIHWRHGKLDGTWRDCAAVELLIGDGG